MTSSSCACRAAAHSKASLPENLKRRPTGFDSKQGTVYFLKRDNGEVVGKDPNKDVRTSKKMTRRTRKTLARRTRSASTTRRKIGRTWAIKSLTRQGQPIPEIVGERVVIADGKVTGPDGKPAKLTIDATTDPKSINLKGGGHLSF